MVRSEEMREGGREGSRGGGRVHGQDWGGEEKATYGCTHNTDRP
jgi:hypothetical protein